MGIVRLKDKPPPRVVRVISKDPRPIGWRMPPTPSRGKSMNPATGTPFYTEAARQSLQQADHERALQMRMNRYYAMARSSDPTTKEAGERGVAEVQALQSARYAKMSRGVDGVANPEVAINLQRHNINSDPVFGAFGGPSVPGTPRGRQAAALVQQARFGAINEYHRGEADRNSLFRSRVDGIGPGAEDEFEFGDPDDYNDAGPDLPPGQPPGRWVDRERLPATALQSRLPPTVRQERLPPTVRKSRDAPGAHETRALSRFGDLGDTSRQLQRQLRTDETEEQDRGDARARRPSVSFEEDIPNQAEIERQMAEWLEKNKRRAEGWAEEEEEETEPLDPAPARAPDSPNTAQRKKDEREAADARHEETMRAHVQQAQKLYEAERLSRGLKPWAEVEAERVARWKAKEEKAAAAASAAAVQAVDAAAAAGETPATTTNEASGPPRQVMVDSNGPPELAVPVQQPTHAAAAPPAAQAEEEEESKYPQAAEPDRPPSPEEANRLVLANTFYLDESLLSDNKHGRNREQAQEMIEDYRRHANSTADYLVSNLGAMLRRRQESPLDDSVYKPLIDQIGHDAYRHIVAGIQDSVKARVDHILRFKIDGWVKNGTAPLQAATPATIVADAIRQAIYGVTETVATTEEPAALFGYDNPTPAQVEAIHGLLEIAPPLITDAVERAEAGDTLRANQYAADNNTYRWVKHRVPLFITPRPVDDPVGAEVRLPPVAARQPSTPQASTTPPRVESPPKTPNATTPQRAASPQAAASPSSTLSNPRSQASSRRSSLQSVLADPLLDQSGFATPLVNRNLPLSAHSSPAARQIAEKLQAEQDEPASDADEGWSDRGDSEEEYVDLDNPIKRDYYRKLAVAYNTYSLNNNVWPEGAPAKVTEANNKSAMSKLLSEMAKAIKGLNPEDRAAQAIYTQKNIKRALRDKSVRDQLAGLQGAELKQKAKLAVGRYHKKKPGAAPGAADKPAAEAPKKKVSAKQSAQASKSAKSNLAFLKQVLPIGELAVPEGPVANALVQAGAAAARGTLDQFFKNEMSFARSSTADFIGDRAADKDKLDQERTSWFVMASHAAVRGRKLRAGLSAILKDLDNDPQDPIGPELTKAVNEMLVVKEWRQLFSQIKRSQTVMGVDGYVSATRQAYNKSLGATLQAHMPADNDALKQMQTDPEHTWLFPLLAAGLKAASVEGEIDTNAQGTLAGAIIAILDQLPFQLTVEDPSAWPSQIITQARRVGRFVYYGHGQDRTRAATLFTRVAQAYRKDSDSPEKPRPILSEQSSGPQLAVTAAPQVSVPMSADERRALLESRIQKGIQRGSIRTLSYVNPSSPGSPLRPPSSLDLRGPPSVIGQNLSSAVLDAQVDAAYQVADEQKTIDALRTNQAAAVARTRNVMRRDAFMGFTGEEPVFESFMREPRDQRAARRESGRLSSSPSSRRSSLSSEGPEPSDFLLANFPFSGDRSLGSDSDGTSDRRRRPLSHLGPALRVPRRPQQGTGEEDMLPPAPRRSLGLPPADVVAQLGTYELPLYDRSEMKSNSVSTSNLFTRTAYYPNDQKTNSLTPKLTVQLGAVSDPNTRFNAKRKVRPPLGWASIDDGPASKMARRGF
jgi:hypothetical protein